jgi:hypothetical protein
MTLTFADLLATLVFAAIGSGLGTYFTAYLRTKGENFAKQEDLLKVVEQTKAVAVTTESIRADLSGILWITQELWKHKMDLYVTALTVMDDAAGGWEALRDGQTSAAPPKLLDSDELQKMMVLAQIVNPGLIAILQPLGTARTPAPGSDRTAHAAVEAALQRGVYHAIAVEARRDLGYEGLGQPSSGR